MALSRDQCSAIIDSCIAQLFELISSRDGWTELSPEDGVQRSHRSLPDGRQIVRGIGTINFSPQEIKDFILDLGNKKSWDSMLEESFQVCDFGNELRVNYEHFTAPWPVSHRDFVYAGKVIQRDDGLLLAAKSVDMGVPERDGIVRGEVITSGFYLKRIGERQTEVTYLTCADMKGMLPGFVVDMIGQEQTSNVRKIREAMNKKAGISN
jgi:hypothetical protein